MTAPHETAVLSRPRVREGQEKSVKPKREAEAACQAEHDAIAGELAEVEANLKTAQDAGDPDGRVPSLVAERRQLRERLEESAEVLVARTNATAGAMNAQHRLVLAEIAEYWAEQDLEGTEERVRERAAELLDSLDQLTRLASLHRSLLHWANHIAVARLGGVQVPPLRTPQAVPAPAVRAVADALSTLTKKEDAA